MATYIRQEAGRFLQTAAAATSAGAADADKVVATGPDGLIDDTLINANTVGNEVVVKTLPSGLIDDVTMGAALSGNDVVLKTDSNGKISAAVMPTGFGDDIESLVAGEALAAGDYVHITTGFEVVKATAGTEHLEAHGFVLAAAAADETVEVHFEGTNTAVTGVAAGKVYLSDTVPGAGQATPPTTVGNMVQLIGFGTSSTSVNFDSHAQVVLEA